MAKKSESLEEGLNQSADKRHLSGPDRHRYIGGALHNMGKAKTRSGKREPAPAKPTTHHAPVHHTPAPAQAPAKRQAYQSPSLTVRKHLRLTVKRNAEESKRRGYPIYSIYKDDKLYSSTLYTKKPNAENEAKNLMSEYNDPRGVHRRESLISETPRSSAPAPKKAEPKPRKVAPAGTLALTVRKNEKASEGKPYEVYSIYKSGEKSPYSSQLFRKRATAVSEAKIEMDRHNHPHGEYKRGHF